MRQIFGFVTILCFTFSLNTWPQTQSDPLQVAFLLVDGVYNTEVMAPFDIFQHTIFHTRPGMKVFTVAPSEGPITTFEGLRIIPDYAFGDKAMPNIDILVVASAEHSMDRDLENQRMIDFVHRHGKKAKFILSLCDGAFVLAKARLLAGRAATTFPSDIPRFRQMFPQITVHENVSFVHDGPAITSAGGVKSYDAAMYLVQLLYGETVARNVGKGLIIDWNLQQIPHQFIEP